MNADVNELVGQVVEERYRIETVLGAGAMGAVYRARHVRVGREVAIKVLHDHLIEDPEMVARFEREAAIAARLDHKNVISVLDVGVTPTQRRMMVLELARGVSLGAIVDACGPLAHARVIDLVGQLLDGLDHAHRAGLVHRDLKPDNIMVELDGTREVPRIVDFGIAVLREGTAAETRRLTAAGVVMGTPEYMAPEHAQGKELDARADLFSLGVIVYELLAGKLPFSGSGVDVAIANITRDPPPIAHRAPGVVVDPLLEAFARKLMARGPGDRFATAAAAREVLALIEGDPDAARARLLPEACETQPLRVRVRGSRAPMPALPRPLALAETLEVPRGEREGREPRPIEVVAPCRPAKPTQRTSLVPWRALGIAAGVVIGAIAIGLL